MDQYGRKSELPDNLYWRSPVSENKSVQRLEADAETQADGEASPPHK
jgi:hypothetical protein